ncbi:MAG: cache domain-containing protein [Paracoccaceae bacterium]
MRTRLLIIALLPMLLVMPIFISVVIYNWSTRIDNLLIAQVNSELTIAHQYLAGLRERSFENLQSLGASADLLHAYETGTLPELLELERQRYGFDFLYVLKVNGEIISANNVGTPKNPARWPVVKSAITGAGGAEIDLFTAENLAAFTPKLAVRANIPLVPTKAALPSTRTEETRGMVVHSAAPISGCRFRPCKHLGDGALVAGVLLNQNLDFIDTINALVYPQASLTEGSLGTTTLFLEDVRISTNVRLFENVRALGTRVSKEVRAAVLDEGHTWLDRAFVVNDWYISAYEPLLDSFGNRIGMLYVGFLDSPYRAAKTQTLWLIGGGFFLLLLLSIPLFLSLARGVFKPLEQIVNTISAVESGEVFARTGLKNKRNEISLVSRQIDALLDNVQERDQCLRDLADELETRVQARTKELFDANKQLELATKQLVISEKLAAIGEITAGVAHEINNPVAVIQGNLDVIRETMGEAAHEFDAEFRLLNEQVHRINTLVNKLLQFARPEEFSGSVVEYSPNDIVRDTLPLVRYLFDKAMVKLTLTLSATRSVNMNKTELQQVLINLMVNAIHAMPNGGDLKVECYDHKREGREGILLKITDTGTGTPHNKLLRIFDPFYTTKQSQGTGLGLSISQKLLLQSGGEIWATSEVGRGSVFFVFLECSGVGSQHL